MCSREQVHTLVFFSPFDLVDPESLGAFSLLEKIGYYFWRDTEQLDAGSDLTSFDVRNLPSRRQPGRGIEAQST